MTNNPWKGILIKARQLGMTRMYWLLNFGIDIEEDIEMYNNEDYEPPKSIWDIIEECVDEHYDLCSLEETPEGKGWELEEG